MITDVLSLKHVDMVKQGANLSSDDEKNPTFILEGLRNLLLCHAMKEKCQDWLVSNARHGIFDRQARREPNNKINVTKRVWSWV